MLKQCLENIGAGLLHACISSIIISDEIFQLSHIIRIVSHYSVPLKKIQNVNQVFSQIHVRLGYIFFLLLA